MPINIISRKYVVFDPPDAYAVLNPVEGIGIAYNASTSATTGARSAAATGSTGIGTSNNGSVSVSVPPAVSDPPTPSAIAGMSSTPYRNWDWTGATPLAPGWVIVNGDDTPNGELSASKPSNVTVETDDPTCSGGTYLRLATRREVTFGQPFSGVQMENFSSGFFGAGQPFYVEVRLRWTGYEGCWPGPWMIQYPATPNSEIDIMETPNTRQPWTTLHPYGWAQNVHVGAQYASTNDGGWHRYGLRVDRTGVYRYFDNVHVSSYLNATHASVFVDANMGLKFQHFCGGTWPDQDLGLPAGTTPRANVSFPNYFDCDYFRIYR